MKQFLLSVSLCLFSTVFYAQNDKIIYLDSIGDETQYTNHITSIIIKDFKSERNQYNVYEYYKSGKLKSEGVCSNKWALTKEGIFSTYYESGNTESRTMYDKGLPYGDFTSWHENGNKKTEGEYLIFENPQGMKTSELKIKNYWDENNIQRVFNGNGIYTVTDKSESASGEVNNGVKQGLWEAKSTSPETNNRKTYSETYKKGKLISGTSFDENSNPYNYTELNTQAGPKKGMEHFYRFVSGKIDVPSKKPHQDQMKLLASFIINKDGKISEVKILRGDSKINKSLESALLKYPNWNPALQRGRPVRSKFTLPITINTGI
ncbi:hypothetical protein FLJC2902T_00750 [Flavobacterium limnosediminis JC2902]|uniref:TonB C-terminal domain-containing protein n=1 Tax=Flavobacterium limnosediminis JC2902 TaxID=1341181 RepID=V6SYW6_9FLAO|nr:hypothetical protein [Flavobacterium limnosediminis]ESU29605.1 hypothetical protein FLJC2902T_00750 [Flavobacterium limnosediminis JC2902]